ncbi:MAG: PIN domain-containing protein [Dehalococcoidia bacterium]|nr:PIN domain-containing protein [Dehalococcoidia bacterium]
MSGDFLDSNVLIYLWDATDLRKREIADHLVDEGLRGGRARISHQVVQETLNFLTTKARPPSSPADTRRFLELTLLPFWRIHPTPDMYRRGLEIRERYGYGFYDSLIVAAALEAGCDRLYSEDLQHGQRIEGLTIENPFRD